MWHWKFEQIYFVIFLGRIFDLIARKLLLEYSQKPKFRAIVMKFSFMTKQGPEGLRFVSPDVFLSSSGIRGGIFISVLQLACFIWKPEQFGLQVYGGCVTQACDRVCRKINTNLLIFEPFRSQSIRKSAYVNSCLFSTSTDNQSPRSRKPK